MITDTINVREYRKGNEKNVNPEKLATLTKSIAIQILILTTVDVFQ
jgi:hypothetical protein